MPRGDLTPGALPTFWVAAGPRAVERLLLAEIDRHLPPDRTDLSELRAPVFVIVPSASLRRHVCARIVAHRQRPLAGLSVRTHRTLAVAVLQRAGEAPPAGEAAFPLLVRRAARAQPLLREVLEPFGDGYASVALSVRDLLDAGFTSSNADALLEQLDALGAARAATPGDLARAGALVQVAALVDDELERRGLGRVSTLLRRAAELVQLRGDAALRARAMLIHGFADAVTLTSDFLHELLRLPQATLLLDHPPDPADRAQTDVAAAFTQRFVTDLARGAPLRAAPAPEIPAAQLRTFCAGGVQAETREVARRVRALLAQGARAERIGVVARSLDAYRLPVRLHFGRLGIPFSGHSAVGPSTRLHRRVAALLELLRGGERTPVGRWLDTLQIWGAHDSQLRQWAAGEPLRSPVPPLFEIRLALSNLGLTRLSDVAGLDVGGVVDGADRFYLSVRRGLEEESDRDDRERSATVAPRRFVTGHVLRALAAAAGRAQQQLRAWPERGSLRAHVEALEHLLRSALAWGEHDSDAAQWDEALAAVSSSLPEQFALERDEWLLLLRQLLADVGRSPVGGDGGGVQLLSVAEARARTFEHLFLLGVNRDAFPRAPRRDPLLPDAVREPLRTTLPGLPLKSSAFDEERYLFAQLLESAGAVTVSWLSADDEGAERTPSPLLYRLMGTQPQDPIEQAPPLTALEDICERTALEGAIAIGLNRRVRGPREPWELVLQAAIEEGWRELGAAAPPLDASRLAAASARILHEFDRAPQTSAPGGLDPGPWFGFVGAVRPRGDPRANELFVTTLEDLARCPWRTFLRRVLHLEPLAEAGGTMPGLDAALRGRALHAVLARIVGAAQPNVPAAPTQLHEARQQPAHDVPWPTAETLEAWLTEECARVVHEARLGLPGLARLLREQVRPSLELVRQLEWSEQRLLPGVLGAELAAVIPLDELAPHAAARRLHCRADRVDVSSGALVLTDYKSGAPLSLAKKVETRANKLRAAVQAGTALQGALYARAAGDGAAVGRYLYLGGDDPPERVFTIDSGDTVARAALASALRALLPAWEQGTLFPRLLDPALRAEPKLCDRCEVKAACVRGDSGLRERLRRWIDARRAARVADADQLSTTERVLLDLWALGPDSEAVPGPGEDAS